MSELPPAPAGTVGWPWTGEGEFRSGQTSQADAWPRVSVVTPSYNQASFVEATIRSVLLQGYSNLEYIIIDGGSTDGSVEIIRKYEPWLAHWVSEPDEGQTQAINKGFRKATGQVVAWLNSDDIYLPGAIWQAVRALHDQDAAVVCSQCNLVTPEGDFIDLYRPATPITLRSLLMFWQFHYAIPPQPTVFLRRHVLERVGLLDETLHYALDYELWLRVVQHFEFSCVDAIWANYVIHPQSKTGQGWEPFVAEICRIGSRYWHHLSLKDHMTCRFGGRRMMIARRYLDRAFDASKEGDWPEAKSWLRKAVRVDPSRLFNRGVLSLCRKAWGRGLLVNRAGTNW